MTVEDLCRQMLSEAPEIAQSLVNSGRYVEPSESITTVEWFRRHWNHCLREQPGYQLPEKWELPSWATP